MQTRHSSTWCHLWYVMYSESNVFRSGTRVPSLVAWSIVVRQIWKISIDFIILRLIGVWILCGFCIDFMCIVYIIRVLVFRSNVNGFMYIVFFNLVGLAMLFWFSYLVLTFWSFNKYPIFNFVCTVVFRVANCRKKCTR